MPKYRILIGSGAIGYSEVVFGVLLLGGLFEELSSKGISLPLGVFPFGLAPTKVAFRFHGWSSAHHISVSPPLPYTLLPDKFTASASLPLRDAPHKLIPTARPFRGGAPALEDYAHRLEAETHTEALLDLLLDRLTTLQGKAADLASSFSRPPISLLGSVSTSGSASADEDSGYERPPIAFCPA